MPTFSRIAAFLLSTTLCLSCQTSSVTKTGVEALLVPSLGIRYTPPSGMLDKTSTESRKLRDRAAEYANKAAVPILDLSSADADNSPAWHQVWITLFPRAQMAGIADGDVKAKLSTALAGPRAKPVGDSQHITIGEQDFLVSEFVQEEPPLVKHAKIYTTVRKTQIVSFVFVSNSPIHVKAMEESLKSLEFLNP